MQIIQQNNNRFPNYQRIIVTLTAAFLGLVSSCSTFTSHKISHAGFSVEVPHDWGDYTHEAEDCLTVARIWGSVNFGIAKAPGKSEELLELFRKTFVTPPNTGTEEKITEWYGFKGHGFRFRRFGKDGGILQEIVIFFPGGELAGWYINATVTDDEPGSRSGFNQVIRSLKKTK